MAASSTVPRHAGRERGVAAAPRSGARPVRRRVGTRRAAPVQLAHHPQQSSQQPAQRTAAADGAREEVCGGAGRRPRPLQARPAPGCAARVERADASSPSCRRGGSTPTDVARGWLRSCPAGRRSRPAQRGSQGRGRRIGASCDIGVDERPHRRWQQVLDRGQRPVAFYGEVSPGQRRAPREPAHDVGIQASGCEERRLHGDRLDLLTRADAGVDEDHPPVSPRRLAGLARRHLQGAAGDRRGQQAEPPQAVVGVSFATHPAPTFSLERTHDRREELFLRTGQPIDGADAEVRRGRDVPDGGDFVTSATELGSCHLADVGRLVFGIGLALVGPRLDDLVCGREGTGAIQLRVAA